MTTGDAVRDPLATTLVTPDLLRSWPLPVPTGDKGHRGTVLIVGGGRQTVGAVLLAAEAALRVGAGKVQVATAEGAGAALGAVLPEVYVEGLEVSTDGDLLASGAARVLELALHCDAMLIGPGLMHPDAAAALMGQVVPRLDTVLVIDALGTAYLTEHPDGVAHLEGRVLLTPNPTELAATLRLPEDAVDDDLLAAAVRLAQESRATVLSGDSTSYLVQPSGRAWRNETGVPGLATAGSGDTKAGAIVGLCARGASPQQAALWGAHCHGLAGERLAARSPGFLARDVVRELPCALAEIEDG